MSANGLLKAAINGGWRPAQLTCVPVSPPEIAAEALAAVGAGATVVHFHPRAADGAETLEPAPLEACLRALGETVPGVPVGVTTGLWACAGPSARLGQVRNWTALPDFASVAFAEEGAEELASLLLSRGIAIESAAWTLRDMERLLECAAAARSLRILIEPQSEDPSQALADAEAMLEALRRKTREIPVLLHGAGATAWPLYEAAERLGLEQRIGLEDTSLLPDGKAATGNAPLVEAALALRKGNAGTAGSAPRDRELAERTVQWSATKGARS